MIHKIHITNYLRIPTNWKSSVLNPPSKLYTEDISVRLYRSLIKASLLFPWQTDRVRTVFVLASYNGIALSRHTHILRLKSGPHCVSWTRIQSPLVENIRGYSKPRQCILVHCEKKSLPSGGLFSLSLIG